MLASVKSNRNIYEAYYCHLQGQAVRVQIVLALKMEAMSNDTAVGTSYLSLYANFYSSALHWKD
jgi:hypothetical protein